METNTCFVNLVTASFCCFFVRSQFSEEMTVEMLLPVSVCVKLVCVFGFFVETFYETPISCLT